MIKMVEKITLEEQVIEIENAIHKIHLNKLTDLDTYIKNLTNLAKGEAEVRTKLSKEGLGKHEVKRLGEMAKTYVNEKNIIREIRYAIKLVNMEEQRLRELKARLLAEQTLRR